MMSRKQMCTMLCNMGHDMQDLKTCSDNELMQMCNRMDDEDEDDMDMMGRGVMENSMSRKQMCTMLCNMGHDMMELEDYSDSKLMKMCKSMNKDEDEDMDMMESQSTRIIKSWKNFR